MGVEASVVVLGNAVTTIETFIDVFVAVYTVIIFIYILSSWIPLPYSPTLSRVQRFLYDVCEPYLRLFRRLLPSLGPIDISPILAVGVLWLARTVIVQLLDRFA